MYLVELAVHESRNLGVRPVRVRFREFLRMHPQQRQMSHSDRLRRQTAQWRERNTKLGGPQRALTEALNLPHSAMNAGVATPAGSMWPGWFLCHGRHDQVGRWATCVLWSVKHEGLVLFNKVYTMNV